MYTTPVILAFACRKFFPEENFHFWKLLFVIDGVIVFVGFLFRVYYIRRVVQYISFDGSKIIYRDYMYRIIKNPSYIGNDIMLIGFAFIWDNAVSMLLSFLAVFYSFLTSKKDT